MIRLIPAQGTCADYADHIIGPPFTVSTRAVNLFKKIFPPTHPPLFFQCLAIFTFTFNAFKSFISLKLESFRYYDYCRYTSYNVITKNNLSKKKKKKRKEKKNIRKCNIDTVNENTVLRVDKYTKARARERSNVVNSLINFLIFTD